MSEEKHPVRNSIIATVIGGLLLALSLYLIPSLWTWLVSVSTSVGTQVYSFLITTVVIPVWLLGIMILAIIPTAIRIVTAFKSPPQSTWWEYQTDNFDGMVWRWGYDKNGITNLWCFCPNDDTTLVYSHNYRNDYTRTVFQCETCRRQFGPFDGDKSYIIAKIERQIDRKIRTGEWEKTMINGHVKPT